MTTRVLLWLGAVGLVTAIWALPMSGPVGRLDAVVTAPTLPTTPIDTTTLPVATLRASTMQGRLYRVGPDGRAYGAGGIPVTVWHPQYGRSNPSYTAFETGVYTLYNIPPGVYTLELWISPSQPQTVGIRVDGQPIVVIGDIRVP